MVPLPPLPGSKSPSLALSKGIEEPSLGGMKIQTKPSHRGRVNSSQRRKDNPLLALILLLTTDGRNVLIIEE
jgi:hypothetical protein